MDSMSLCSYKYATWSTQAHLNSQNFSAYNMRSVFIVLLISLSVLALAEGIRIIRPPPPPPCPRACTREYRPLCAVWKRGGRTSACTFANKCVLENQICQSGQNWQVRDGDGKCRRNSPDCSDILK